MSKIANTINHKCFVDFYFCLIYGCFIKLIRMVLMQLNPKQKMLVESLTKEILTNSAAMVRAIETARPENRDALFNALNEPVINDASFVDQKLIQTVAKYACQEQAYHANYLLGVIADHRSDLIDRTLLENHIGAIRRRSIDGIWSACVMIRKRPDLMDTPLVQEFAEKFDLDNLSACDEAVKTVGKLIFLRPELADDKLVAVLAVPSLSCEYGNEAISSIMEVRPDLKQALVDRYLKKCSYIEIINESAYVRKIAAVKALGRFIHENPEFANQSLLEKLLKIDLRSCHAGDGASDTTGLLALSVIESVGLIIQVRPELANQDLVSSLTLIIRDQAHHLIRDREKLSTALDVIGMIAETRSDLMDKEFVRKLVEYSPNGWGVQKTEILLKVVERIFEKKLPHPDDEKWIEGIIEIDRRRTGGIFAAEERVSPVSKRVLAEIGERRPDLKFWILNAA